MKVTEYFNQKGTRVIYKKNENIISPSREPGGIFLIDSGYVFSGRVLRNGKREIQIILKPGEIFPLIWGLKRVRKHYFYQALTNVDLMVISKNDLNKVVKKWPDFSIEIINVLASYLDTYTDRLDNLESKNIRKRLLKRLIFLGKRFGKKHGSNVILDFPITHKLISESINASRENTTRELNKLEKEKIITLNNHKLTVLDLKLLKRHCPSNI